MMSAVLSDLTIAIPKPVRRVAVAADPKSPRYALHSVKLTRDDRGNCTAAATDSRRCHAYRWNDGIEGAAVDTLVPGRVFAKAEAIEPTPNWLRETHHREFVGHSIEKGERRPYGTEGRFPVIFGGWGVVRDIDDVRATWRGLEWVAKLPAGFGRKIELPATDGDFAYLADEPRTPLKGVEWIARVSGDAPVAFETRHLRDVVKAILDIDRSPAIVAGFQGVSGFATVRPATEKPVHFRHAAKGIEFIGVVMPLSRD